jgi:Tol biopolymer transport system component
VLQLTRSASDNAPAWSPDGRFVAFSRYENNLHEIDIVSAIGGTERKLYSGAPAHPALSWSPDGKLIAFTTKEPNRNTYSISLFSLESLKTRKLTEPVADQQDWGPAFSADGKELAFVRTNGAVNMGDIFVVPSNGGEVRRLTFDNTDIGSPPTWTRDGRSIVFSSPRTSIPTLWRIPVSGGDAGSGAAGWSGHCASIDFSEPISAGLRPDHGPLEHLGHGASKTRQQGLAYAGDARWQICLLCKNSQ